MSNEVVSMQDMFRHINEAADLSCKSYVISKELACVIVNRVLHMKPYTAEAA